MTSTDGGTSIKHGGESPGDVREDVLLENLALSCLRVAKVHHLVHEFVDDDKVVADGFLFEFFEVLDEDGDEAVKEEDDFCGIGIAFRECED